MTIGNIAILGDSRSFDTYYLNENYESFYGYDKTFPFLLRRKVLFDGPQAMDVVHIPDHFRGGTVESNTLRIAMTNPSMVYLIDGIWETLLNKNHFINYVITEVERHSLRSNESLHLEYSHESLHSLFVQNKLEISPAKYAQRIRSLTSYFIRRRRHCCWMSLIMPDPAYKNRVHYAGDYKCSPFWNEALHAVNESVVNALDGSGGEVMDLHKLMMDFGGEEKALIDQWHFSADFHHLLSERLWADIHAKSDEYLIDPDHVSNRHMLPNRSSGDAVVVYGELAEEWASKNQDMSNVEVAKSVQEIIDAQAPIVVLASMAGVARDAEAENLLPLIPHDKILVFPEEFLSIRNPTKGQ